VAQGRGGVLAWSAGCSTGEEPYSPAFQLADLGFLKKSYLLGTDLRHDAVAQAKAGLFRRSATAGLGAEVVDRYFEPHGDEFRVTADLRGQMRWRVADMLAANEPGLWDLILFRNAAIYLRADVAKPLSQRLEASLRP
jgi:chemotaxis protein methyltransferase CheR